MPDITTILRNGFNSLLDNAGNQIRITRFTSAIGSVWSDDVTLTQDSTLWTSGIVLNLDKKEGSTDSILMEQGKIINNDVKLFVHGSVIITGSEYMTRIGIGSPPGIECNIIPEGIITINVANTPIYKKIYLRRITGIGSLLGE